jgi:opacity protein-like surface antigen
MKWLLVLFAALALTASAADVAGTWKASMETPNGTMENTFVFKVNGANLTGSMNSEMMGERPISDGKVDGDNVSFTVKLEFGGNAFELKYKGKVAGNDLKLQMTLPQGDQTIEITAKKVS